MQHHCTLTPAQEPPVIGGVTGGWAVLSPLRIYYRQHFTESKDSCTLSAWPALCLKSLEVWHLHSAHVHLYIFADDAWNVQGWYVQSECSAGLKQALASPAPTGLLLPSRLLRPGLLLPTGLAQLRMRPCKTQRMGRHQQQQQRLSLLLLLLPLKGSLSGCDRGCWSRQLWWQKAFPPW